MKNKNSKQGIPPEWIYPLYKVADRDMFHVLIRTAKNLRKVSVKGKPREIDQFIKLLIVTTKLKKWRTFVLPVVGGLHSRVLNIPRLVAIGGTLKIPKGIDRSWAVYTQDERLCLAIDALATRRVQYRGSHDALIEFVCRFLLTELLQDWRGPKMMVAMESARVHTVSLKRLNSLLALWDFTGIFNPRLKRGRAR